MTDICRPRLTVLIVAVDYRRLGQRRRRARDDASPAGRPLALADTKTEEVRPSSVLDRSEEKAEDPPCHACGVSWWYRHEGRAGCRAANVGGSVAAGSGCVTGAACGARGSATAASSGPTATTRCAFSASVASRTGCGRWTAGAGRRSGSGRGRARSGLPRQNRRQEPSSSTTTQAGRRVQGACRRAGRFVDR